MKKLRNDPLTLNDLPPGIALEVARLGGIDVPQRDTDKLRVRCPLHEDRRPSAFLSRSRNLFCCAVCGSLSAKALAEALSVPWPLDSMRRERWRRATPAPRRPAKRPSSPRALGFTPADALDTWRTARARARDDDAVAEDLDVYDYMNARQLGDVYEEDFFGIIADGLDLHPAVKDWPKTGHRLVAPLYDDRGRVANVQARAVRPSTRKVLFPRGSSASGIVFANAPGRELLRGAGDEHRVAIVGEGLSDFLALAMLLPGWPVSACPSVPFAARAIGRWARGRAVFLAFDTDAAGLSALEAGARAVVGAGGKALKFRWPTDCKDACDTLAKFGPESTREALESALKEAARAYGAAA